MKKYNGFVPPCGIYCGGCPNYLRYKNPCLGAEKHCKERNCKSIYVCCKEKKGYEFCFECKTFPCSRFKKFSESWIKLGQDLILNQQQLRIMGVKRWLENWNQKNITKE
ncbi:DUF3795 domain-containing protein [Pseudobacteroides cellulosolvens]|uniref:DUF3795 domain-containing protein n=1 Tax=Pseudobacteroides cellulosolvens ATCC 35603 = DSM 2933 TaxID=398512 RepID=A0A0L6JWV7_9FIRM|nr:DUF3795 domain-containing protein [Pseudobacteroides cellulosolvens]KNY29922.1 Protein of unknown function DUF3795 [Pseudobacteroides cellulosolvens ATCC 35603 = DSM 2933]